MAHLRPAVHRTILVVDVEGFGDRRRTNPHRVAVRGGLYRGLRQAFSDTGIPWAACHHEDRGDGVFVLVPADVPKGLLLESLPGALAGALREHNRACCAEERVRLRMALHAGEINYDDYGAVGESINLAFRLVDADPLRAALAGSPGELALIVSSWFFDEVVRHSAGSDPARYRRVPVMVKETATVGWICLPDHPYPRSSLGSPSAEFAAAVPHGPPVPAPHRGRRSARQQSRQRIAPADAASVGGVETAAALRRCPWMAPPLDRMVDRPDLAGRLVAALTAPGVAEVGLTTGLAGAGGFGKTTLATWVCHQPEIARRYPGGLLWVSVGQEIRGADLAERVNDLAFTLSGRRPPIADPDVAGAELGRLLDEHEPVLLVVDDVWEASQLRPFRFGGRACTRLVTTRIPDLLPRSGPHIAVDAMSAGQAGELVADGVTGLAAGAADRLAAVAGRWPVLLNLVNGVLRRWVDHGQPAGQAAEKIISRLIADGPAALDPARPADRGKAVAATVDASLGLLTPADRERYLDLAIFPEDVDIPLDVLTLLWPGCQVDVVCDELTGLGLAADYRLDPPGPRLVLHDVLRGYLRARRSAEDRTEVHRRLVRSAAALLPAARAGGPTPWWLLPGEAGYLWRFVPHHLREAGESGELDSLVCDLRWAEAKTRRFGSAVGVEADLALAGTPATRILAGALRRAAHLLGPIDPPAALAATLASRLHGVAGLQEILQRYRATQPRPWLEPAWPPPDSADPLRLPVPPGHTGGVTSCAFSPDGQLLATTSDDGTARLWRVADTAAEQVLAGHTGGVWGCAFSPDGALLATASHDRTVRLWQVADGAARVVLAHSRSVTCCAFSPDGSLLATATDDGTIRLWGVAERAARHELAHSGCVTSCAFSPDGGLLATTSDDGTARLWGVGDHVMRAELTNHTGGLRGCAFSPGGALLATAGDDGTARLWSVNERRMRAELTGHTSGVWACAFSPDGGLLATASNDGTVRLWHVADRTTKAELTGHGAAVKACAFSPDGSLLASTSLDQTTRLWQLADATMLAQLPVRTGRVNRCAFSPDGVTLATTSIAGTARLWQVADRTQGLTLTGHTGGLRGCAFSLDGTLLATASNDRTARLWQVADGAEWAVVRGHTGWVRGCAFSPDGTLLATVSNDRTARLWQVANGAQRAVLTGHTDVVTHCAFSPDGTLLATTSHDRTARLWQVADGTRRAVLTGHTDMVNGCAFSPDGGLLATASNDWTARLWQVADGAEWAVVRGHTGWVDACVFSPDGTLLATAGNDGTVRLWTMTDRRCACALRVTGPLVGLAWHPADPILCAVGGAGIHLLRYQP